MLALAPLVSSTSVTLVNCGLAADQQRERDDDSDSNALHGSVLPVPPVDVTHRAADTAHAKPPQLERSSSALYFRLRPLASDGAT
jgi:hypothetical protein